MSDLDELARAAQPVPSYARRVTPRQPRSGGGGVATLVFLACVLAVLGSVAIGWWLYREYRDEQIRQQLIEKVQAAAERAKAEQARRAEAEAERREAERRQRDSKIFADP